MGASWSCDDGLVPRMVRCRDAALSGGWRANGRERDLRAQRLLRAWGGVVVWWERLRGEAVAAIGDGDGAVQMGVDVDVQPGIAAAARAGMQLEEAAIELDGVVVLDGPVVLEAADAIEVRARRRRAPGRRGVRGRLGKARIVAGEKPVEDLLGLGERAGLGEAQFNHQAILKGAEEALDAAFGLRRVSGDPADAEFPEGPADLGLARGSAELLL